jgi:hypothetical protein
VFSSFPQCPTRSVECSRDILELGLGHWSVHDKELLDQEIGTSPSFGEVLVVFNQ